MVQTVKETVQKHLFDVTYQRVM